jgi:FKBP-type peptidyl-prolyl cis-trans isomerase FklB
MKIKELIITVCAGILLSSCAQNEIQNVKLLTKEDSLSYAIGVSTYSGVTNQGWDIDPVVLARGMMDAKDGDMILNDVAANGYIQMYMQQKQEEELKNQYSAEIEEGKAFLDSISKAPGVNLTESGLRYEVIVMGEGSKPVETDTVRVHYTGTLLDGTIFDSSVDRGEPVEFPVTGVIKGWVEALQLMPVGSKFRLYIPYELAYGARGAGATIRPFSTLVFDVELLEITNKE